jgi:hypothetical protein
VRFLVGEAHADAIHAADHVIQGIVGVLATGIRRRRVGDIVDLCVKLGLVADTPVRTHVQIQDRVDLVEIVGWALHRGGRASTRGANHRIAVGEHAAGIPAFRQVDAPGVGLVALGLLQLPIQHIEAGAIAALVAAAKECAGQFMWTSPVTASDMSSRSEQPLTK